MEMGKVTRLLTISFPVKSYTQLLQINGSEDKQNMNYEKY